MSFKDFDQAVSEIEDRFVKFQFAGEAFEINLNVPAGKILKWMEHGNRLEAIPALLRTFLSNEDYDRLIGTNANWAKMEALVTWLAEELGGQGNS